MDIPKIIEQYMDLSISMEDLSNFIDVHTLAPPDYYHTVIICKEHAISVLEKYKRNEVSELDVARWAKFVMCSEWCDYCEENYESIASIVAELEAPLLWGDYVDGDYGELAEFMGKLSPEKADSFIKALHQNLEI
ncbi:hypothetical protein [Methanolobus psychrotolerans]|uniref:hypothetical protein n=1 Tax=Methanolobus psychrotolerans TaxID=1874706 RepID=UPI000B916450|nr:hypothetical protein [Methanolobus psychrotolerans]